MRTARVEVVFPGPLYGAAVSSSFGKTDESAGLFLASPVQTEDGDVRLLVREFMAPADSAYRRRSSIEAELSPEFVASVLKRARNEGQSVLAFHTHPFEKGRPRFSGIDTAGEELLAPIFDRRAPGRPHVALVASPDGVSARILGTTDAVPVTIVGSERRVYGPTIDNADDTARFDRQVRAFGLQGQAILSRLRVGVVGLGGTGSLVTETLAHLGVRRFVIVDADKVETSNLNRLAGARRSDVGVPKIHVARRIIQELHSDADIIALPDSVAYTDVARRLACVDFLFSCTDTHGSRAVLNQLAYQYLVPCIDMGIDVATSGGVVEGITGRVQMLAPGLGCLVCGRVLDPELVRRDLLTDAERRVDPYIRGESVPQPAVMSLNGSVASLAVTMFLGATVGVPSRARLQLYNGIKGTVRAAIADSVPECFVCGTEGATARGDTWPLFGRKGR